MNKMIMSAILCAVSCTMFSAARPATPTDRPFTVVFDKKQAFDEEAVYVIGGDVATSDITIGLFKVVRGKPELVVQVHTETKAERGGAAVSVPNFTDYFVKVYNFFKSKYECIEVDAACFAAPGVTSEAKNFIQHHDMWAVDGVAMSRATGISTVFVINDFEITGFGVEALAATHVVTLQAGKPRENGTRLVLGAGNGFGSVLMLWNDCLKSYQPSPISYSYVDFFPYDEQEVQLMQYLQSNTGSRSCGKVLGGHGGVLRIYAFLNGLTEEQFAEFAKNVRYIDIFKDRAKNPKYQAAVDMFMKFYARCVRNAAYAQQPHAGVFITNTIADEFPELFTAPAFMQEVLNTNNGFLRNYIDTIPFYLVRKHDGLRMHGAALYAAVNAPESEDCD